ncbi:MAG: hypothetical protein ABSD74_12535 [Rhizomicrobium sp.]|jgi:hypothetical protein
MTIQTPSSLPVVTPTAAAPAATGGVGSKSDEYSGFSFHDLLSIVNPLQHFPVISTLYRKLTGDTIKPFERIAGDTLYGGWMGLASSVANLVFEKETGKDFGDTVLAWLGGDNDSKPATQVAAAGNPGSTAVTAQLQAPAPAAAQAPPQPTGPTTVQAVSGDPGLAALSASMSASHVDSELAQRAAYAYRRSMTATHAPLSLAPLNLAPAM